MKSCLGILCFVGLSLAADAPRDDASKKDLEQLQGVWRLVSRERDGKADAPEAIKDVLVTHKGDKFSYRGLPSGSGATEGILTIDATKNPKTMDRVPADGPQKGKTLRGIYSLEGDTLKLCVSVTGGERPTAFGTKPDSGLVLAVFKREKP